MPALHHFKRVPNPTYILCPGQGAQLVGMGRDFYAGSPMAKSVLDVAADLLDFDLKAVCFEGPEDRLNQTDVSQPAIFAVSVAAYRALHLGGAFTFEDGLRLVKARGAYMQAAAVAAPSGMVALLGADAAAVDKLCADAAGGEVLVPANYNAPAQIVVSGSRAACERAVKAAEVAGFKATPLRVAGAFHSPLMQPAADLMRAELDRAVFSEPRTPVYSNVTAAPHAGVESIKRLLVEQIVSPVKWEQTMLALIADGGASPRFVELAPNRHLAGLAKRINRRLPIESLMSVDSLKALQ
jgi:[acyl-carrier-protein] S-malonyltransferase